jgi:hypothetical protein
MDSGAHGSGGEVIDFVFAKSADAAPADPPAAPPAGLGAAKALDAPLQNLTDGFALWGRAIHDAVVRQIGRFAGDVAAAADKAARAEASAAAAHAAVAHVPEHVRGAVATAGEATRAAREASGQLAEILHNLAQHASGIGRLSAALDERTARLAALEAGAAALAAEVAMLKQQNAGLKQEIAGLAAGNRRLNRRADRLRTRVVAAFVLTVAGVVGWVFWPELVRHVAPLLGR